MRRFLSGVAATRVGESSNLASSCQIPRLGAAYKNGEPTDICGHTHLVSAADCVILGKVNRSSLFKTPAHDENTPTSRTLFVGGRYEDWSQRSVIGLTTYFLSIRQCVLCIPQANPALQTHLKPVGCVYLRLSHHNRGT